METKTDLWLGYVFQCPSLLELALTHSSYSRTNNERLEFLGDAILGMVVAEWLYDRTNCTEGQMAQSRALIVDTNSLYQAALRLGVGPHLLLGRSELNSGGREKRSILANAVEAIIGAIYLDSGQTPDWGYGHVRQFIIRNLIKGEK